MGEGSALRKRIISSVLMTSLVFLIIFFFPTWVFALLASALIGLSLHEFYAMAAKKGIFVYKHFGISAGMLVPVIVYLQRGTVGYVDLDAAFIVLACLFAFVLQFTRRDNSQALMSIAVTMMGLLYIGWFLSFFVKLKFLPDGPVLVTYLILVTKSSDIGAYFIGRRFGKKSLIPRISPSKTIEGTIGGFGTSVCVSMACATFLPAYLRGHVVVLGAFFGVLSQVGDLAESLLKRDCGVKDSGRKFSGFGGVLDMLDSLFFTAPIFYYYVVMLR